MDVDVDLTDGSSAENEDPVDDDGNDDDDEIVPMPPADSISALRAKLHAKIASIRNKGRTPAGGSGAGSKDELLEERRLQRAAMRERRRRETREKIRLEEERRGKGKGKEKEKEKAKDKAVPTKVRSPVGRHSYIR